MSIKSIKNKKAGFSLFEMLMTIAILGVMGSLAIGAFGDQASSFERTRDRRNAQEIAATCTTAQAAGLNFVVGNEVNITVRKIIQGAAPTGGAFKDRMFKVNLIGEADIAGAMRFLAIQNGSLVFRYDS